LSEEKRRANAWSTWKMTLTTAALNSQCLTSGKGLKQFDAKIVMKKVKKQKEADVKTQQEVTKAAKQVEWTVCGPTQAFSGVLSSKNKDDLVEIADTLGLSLTSENGKHYMNTELVSAIREHLTAHPELEDSAHFASLFSGWGQ